MDDNQPATEPTPGHRRMRRRRGILLIAAVALVSGVLGSIATKALSHGFGHRFHGGAGFLLTGGPIDPVHAQKRAEKMARHLAVEAEASDEQEAKLVAIAQATSRDLIAIRDKTLSSRAKAVELLEQPTVDRPAIEAFRAEHLGYADAVSRRIADGLAEAAEVLTVEQRKALAERIKNAGAHRSWFSGLRRG